MPDSSEPSSFDPPTKSVSTASTRPRLSGGVRSGTSVARMKTLKASAPDSRAMAPKATAKLRVAPSRIVPRPKAATAISSVRPTRRVTGRTASLTMTAAAPSPPAARSHPSPTASRPRRSVAMAGSRAMAPPNRTAKRSSERAPTRIGRLRMKRRPSIASDQVGRGGRPSSSGVADSMAASNRASPSTSDSGMLARPGWPDGVFGVVGTPTGRASRTATAARTKRTRTAM